MIRHALLLAALLGAGSAAGADLASARQAFRGGEQAWPRALAEFGPAAGKGDGAAMFYLALMHRNGMGTPRNSVRAGQLMLASARAGIPAAMFMLSAMLLAGEGMPKDEGAARAWLEAAAADGHPEALQQMSMAVRDGAMGYEVDEARAAQLMKEMAHALTHRAPVP